jgi:hypothetical protein
MAAGTSFLMSLATSFAKDSGRYYYTWLYTLFAILAIPTRMYLARLEVMYAETASARRARYVWAISFWDVDETRKTLSRPHGAVPLNTFLTDVGLATCFILVLAYLIRINVATIHWLFTLGPLALEYYLRFVLHGYLQVQWVSSTLEFHTPQWASSPGKLFSSLMSTHFFRAWTVVLLLFFALFGGWLTTLGYFAIRSSFSGPEMEGSWWLG